MYSYMTNYICINSLCVKIELSFEKFDINGFFPERNPTNNQIMVFACLPDVFICYTQYLSCKLICHMDTLNILTNSETTMEYILRDRRK